jgi:hypothetical protein
LLGATVAEAGRADAADVPPGTAQITIDAARAIDGTPSPVYMIIDQGREGLFAYDPADGGSADNGGTVIVTASGARLKRVGASPINVKWFGARGDGVTDDHAAVQAAVDVAQQPTASSPMHGHDVYIPEGAYALSAPIVLDTSVCIRISGAGLVMTTLVPLSSAAAMNSMIGFRSDGVASGFLFQDFQIDGSAADFGIDIPWATDSQLKALSIKNAGQFGLRIQKGWFNVLRDCVIFSNHGGGVCLGPGEVNDLTVDACVVQGNKGGPGIALTGSGVKQAIAVAHSTVSGNARQGIVVDSTVRALDITQNYFEANNKLVDEAQTDAHIEIGSGLATGPVRVCSNHFWINFPVDRSANVITCNSAFGGLVIETNNVIRGGQHVAPTALLRTGTSASSGGASVNALEVSRNFLNRFTEDYPCVTLQVDDLAGGSTALHEASVGGVYRVNYAVPLLRFHPVDRGSASGRWRKSPSRYRQHEVWSLDGAASTSEWGFEIDVDQVPELAGKYVYFACFAKASDLSTGLVLSTSQLGPNTTNYLGDTDWQVCSYVDLLPSSGVVAFSVSKISESATSTVLLANPVLSEVGVPFGLQESAET